MTDAVASRVEVSVEGKVSESDDSHFEASSNTARKASVARMTLEAVNVG